MNRLSHRVVTTKREGDVRYPTRDHRVGQGALYLGGGFDKVDGIVIVLFDTRGDGENIGIEDDIFRWKPHLIYQYPVGAGTDLYLARLSIGLALFIEGHDDGGRAVAFN